MAEEIVQSLSIGAREILSKSHQLRIATAYARAHEIVVAGRVGLVL